MLSLLLSALALRLALLPLSAGRDFRAYAVLAWLTLHGHDVYGLPHTFFQAHRMPPWTYFPLCLSMYTALSWLSLHTVCPFQVLGKLPVVAADLAIGWLLYMALRRRGHAPRAAMLGMVLYLFNPLVLYNGAFYGRFDALALVFLLFALERYRTGWFAPAYALAIAAKTFPFFLVPLLAFGRDRQTPHRLVLACGLVVVLALPYVITNPHGLLSYLLANTHSISYKGLGRLSWYSILYYHHWLSMAQILGLAHGATLLYPLALLTVVHRPLYVKAAACFTLFLALNRTVYEQYLLWPMPFLIVVALHYRSRLALLLIALYTAAGMVENEQTWARHGYLHFAPLPTPWLPLNLAVAASALAFVGAHMLRHPTPRAPSTARDEATSRAHQAPTMG